MELLNIKDIEQERAKDILNNLDVSELTIKDYKARLGLFFDFVKENPLNHNTYLNFKRNLRERTDISVATKNKYLISAKVFLKEAYRLGHLKRDIASNIKGFQESKKHKRAGLNHSEITKIWEYLNTKTGHTKTAKLKAIFGLLILQGLRQCEVVRLDVKDFEFVNMRLFVRGKGRDDKEAIDLHPFTVNLLKQYCETCKIKDGALFCNTSNNQKGKRTTTRAIYNAVKEVLKACGIEKTPHGARHYFATELINNSNLKLSEVKKYTRHSNINTLQIYNDETEHTKTLPEFYRVFESFNYI